MQLLNLHLFMITSRPKMQLKAILNRLMQIVLGLKLKTVNLLKLAMLASTASLIY